MVRELAIFLYLLLFKCTFFLFNFLPLKEKTTFVVSFGDNCLYILEEMRRQNIGAQVAVLCKRDKMDPFMNYKNIHLVPFESVHPLHWLQSIYHLATSRYIMVDNYYGFLAAVHFKKGVQCIQLWHASGAMKKFGLEEESIKDRSPRAIQRFLRVYRQFHKVVVGSDVMAAIFTKSFNLKKEQILKTGIPRTDFFFNETAIQQERQTLAQRHPEIKDKKVILYAPTYRDQELDHFRLHLDIEKMAADLGTDFILLLRLHPAIKNRVNVSKKYSDFIVDVSSQQYGIHSLLVAADYLITDYSSIVVEYSLLLKPIIFFRYDVEEYTRTRGILEQQLPGPVVSDTDSIIELIHTNRFDLDAIRTYAEIWNKYSKGHSSEHLVQYLFLENSPEMIENMIFS
jgi:teichoic acid glycerol-phosphate primase